jgi:hypothetical protein
VPGDASWLGIAWSVGSRKPRARRRLASRTTNGRTQLRSSDLRRAGPLLSSFFGPVSIRYALLPILPQVTGQVSSQNYH